MKRSMVLLFTLSFIIALGSAWAQDKTAVDSVTGDSGTDVTAKIKAASDENKDGAAAEGDLALAAQTEPEGNFILIKDAFGSVGTDVNMPVLVTTDTEVAGIAFTVEFDTLKLQISATAKGDDALEMDTVGIDIDAANSDGTLEVALIDFYFANPIPVGDKREVYVITFNVAAEGEIPVTLVDVSMSDSLANDIEFTIVDGAVNREGAVEPGDVTGDGSINIFDLLGLLQILAGVADPSVGSDVNNDTNTNIFDLLALLAILAG